MHINLELLECVYLVSAMLIEIPYMAAHEFDARRRMISKSYYQQLRSSERQALVGPPESMREHVVAASKAMRNGDWKRCRDFIINEKMNAKVWDLFYEADKVRSMLSRKIQEETLRTYLFTYSKVYNSISVVSARSVLTGSFCSLMKFACQPLMRCFCCRARNSGTHCVPKHFNDITHARLTAANAINYCFPPPSCQ